MAFKIGLLLLLPTTTTATPDGSASSSSQAKPECARCYSKKARAYLPYYKGYYLQQYLATRIATTTSTNANLYGTDEQDQRIHKGDFFSASSTWTQTGESLLKTTRGSPTSRGRTLTQRRSTMVTGSWCRIWSSQTLGLWRQEAHLYHPPVTKMEKESQR